VTTAAIREKCHFSLSRLKMCKHCGDQSFTVAEDNHHVSARVAPHRASALHSEGGLAAALDVETPAPWAPKTLSSELWIEHFSS
jgi:hypothetical protein